MADTWNRCDECGKFIGMDQFENHLAVRRLLEPSSELGVERWETLCFQHSGRDIFQTSATPSIDDILGSTPSGEVNG